MAEWTLEQILLAIIAVIALVVIAIFLSILVFGPEQFATGCEGEPEGQRCFSVGSGESRAVACPSASEIERFRDSIAFGYDSSICNIYAGNKLACEVTSYPNITKLENLKTPVCLFVEQGRISGLATETACLLNAQLSCADFSSITTPKCGDMPGCRPVNAIQQAIERIKPF